MTKRHTPHLAVIETLSDAELIERIADGHSYFLGELYTRHGDSVLRVLSYILGRTTLCDDVEDLNHEVFLKVLKGSKNYVEQGKFTAWLTSIAIKEARAYRRKKFIRKNLFERFTKESRHAAAIDHVEPTIPFGKQKLTEAFEGLSQSHKEVLVLAISEGMRGVEIAEVLNTSHNAVRAKLYRAREALKKLLEDAEYSQES